MVALEWWLTTEFRRLVALCWEKMAFRPTAVAVVWKQAAIEGKLFLLVQSRYFPHGWGFVQGGIERGEDPSLAVQREVEEEVALPPDALSSPVYLGSTVVRKTHSSREGFKEGSIYLAFAMELLRDEPVFPELAEISNCKWVTLEEARKLLENKGGKHASWRSLHFLQLFLQGQLVLAG